MRTATAPPDTDRRAVTIGVDTHADVHVAAAVDQLGRVLATTSVPTTAAGYATLLAWVRGLGQVQRFGIEGTGSWGAALARYLTAHGNEVVDVNRPDRAARRRNGKSDPLDAQAAARAALASHGAGHGIAVPKTQDGTVEMLRVLRVARRSAMKARVQAGNQLHELLARAPEALREQYRHLPTRDLAATVATLPAEPPTTVSAVTRLTLLELGRRWQALQAEIDRLTKLLKPLIQRAAPSLVALPGVGPETAGALLEAAGDNPDRLRNEAAFAHLCGVAPLPASSGKVVRYRLNPGGHRGANEALWRIVLVRMKSHPPTRAYVVRRTAEGLSKREIMRCLKRYVAREAYRHLRAAAACGQPAVDRA
jgi:transposase